MNIVNLLIPVSFQHLLRPCQHYWRNTSFYKTVLIKSTFENLQRRKTLLYLCLKHRKSIFTLWLNTYGGFIPTFGHNLHCFSSSSWRFDLILLKRKGYIKKTPGIKWTELIKVKFPRIAADVGVTYVTTVQLSRPPFCQPRGKNKIECFNKTN